MTRRTPARLRRQLERASVNARIVAGMASRRFALVGPRIVQIQVPSLCHHRCVFCFTQVYTEEGQVRAQREFDLGPLLRLVDDAIDLDVLKINIMSSGETLLFDRLQELVTHITRRGRGRVKTTVVTNGTLIEGIGADFFIDNEVDLWLSLNAGDAETWGRIHRPTAENPGAVFEGLERSIRTLTASGRCAISLHNVVFGYNYDRLGSIIDFAHRTGVRRLNFRPVHTFPELGLDDAQKASLRAEIPALLARMRALGITSNLHTFALEGLAPGAEGSRPAQIAEFYRRNRCYLGWLMTFVTSEGDVRPCCFGETLGNGFTGSLREIWQSERYAEFRRRAIAIPEQGMVPGYNCAKCSHLYQNDRANRILRFYR